MSCWDSAHPREGALVGGLGACPSGGRLGQGRPGRRRGGASLEQSGPERPPVLVP